MSKEQTTRNDGFYVQNPVAEKPDALTVVVCGPARGGTTMVAKILLNLGVYLGKRLTRHTHEDTEIFKPLEEGRFDKFDKVVARRNAKFQIWGWKRPQSVDRLGEIAPRLRNPFFIFLFRDPASVAKRNMVTAEADFFNSLVSASEAMVKSGQFARHSGYPCLLISYEKAIQNPGHLVDQVVQFLHLEPRDALLNEAVRSVLPENPSYRNMFAEQQIVGKVDGIRDHFIFGWAILKGELDPVSLELWVDGTLVREFSADIFRPDLKAHGIGRGKHAFKVPIGDYINGGETTLLDVRIAGTTDSLLGSPIPYTEFPSSNAD